MAPPSTDPEFSLQTQSTGWMDGNFFQVEGPPRQGVHSSTLWYQGQLTPNLTQGLSPEWPQNNAFHLPRSQNGLTSTHQIASAGQFQHPQMAAHGALQTVVNFQASIHSYHHGCPGLPPCHTPHADRVAEHGVPISHSSQGARRVYVALQNKCNYFLTGSFF